MALSYTYLGLQNQIAYELGQRNDLLSIPSGSSLTLSPIQQAIQNAIAKWEREHFYFNEIESTNTFSTVAGKEYYTAADCPALGTNPHLDKVWVLISSNRYTLNPRTEQYISDISVSTSSQSQPIDYAIYAETMRMYPIPDGAYPITLEGTQRFSTLANPSDTNKWLQDGADLIKAEAKLDLLTHVLKRSDQVQSMKNAIYGDPSNPMDCGYLYALRSESVQRPAVGKMRAQYF